MCVPNLVPIGPQTATCIRLEGYTHTHTHTHTLSYIDIEEGERDSPGHKEWNMGKEGERDSPGHKEWNMGEEEKRDSPGHKE